MSKYQIEGDLGISYQDAGPWRSYEAEGAGDTIESFLDSLTIIEIDQDGGELNCYGYNDAPNAVQNVIDNYIKRVTAQW